MSSVTIRDARPGDRAAIEAVTLSAYEEYAGSMTPTFWAAYRQNILATLAVGSRASQIVAELEGRVVGAVLLYPASAVMEAGRLAIPLSCPEVRLLAVAPTTRQQGVGVALMQECERRARQAGAATLTLHTTDLMRAAMRLYQRLGYGRAPELDFEPAPGVTVKGYRLDLATAE